MTYSTATMGAGATPAKTFMEGPVHTAMLAVGWTYVEEVVATNTARVYKSAVADNGSADVYLLALRNADAGTGVYYVLGEGWNTSTKRLTGYVYIPSSGSSISLDATGRFNDATGQLVSALYSNTYGRFTSVNASGYSYWISVTTKRLLVGSRVGATDNVVYAGFYDNAPTAAATSPQLTIHDGGNGSSGSNREPGISSAGSVTSGLGTQGYTPLYSGSTALEFYGSALIPSPVQFRSLRGTPSLRGYLVDVLGVAWTATPVLGDTVTISGQAYTVFKGTSNTGLSYIASQAL